MRKSRSPVQATQARSLVSVTQPLAKRLLVLALAAAACTTVGCTAFNNIGQSFRYDDTWNNMVSGYRNRSFSAKSWHRHKHLYCNEPCINDFCAGYRQGYEETAAGGNGCTPSFPPREYWGWQYQSAYGQKRVAAWFAGYPHGAKAAEEEGMGSWSQIQMSSGLQAEYVNSGLLPKREYAVYPITEPSGNPANIGAPTPVGTAPAETQPVNIGPAITPVPMNSIN